MSSKKYAIRWEMRFNYIPRDDFPFQASVVLGIPKQQDTDCIPNELISHEVSVFGENLHEGWGNTLEDTKTYEGYRLRMKTVKSSESWNDLLEKVKNAKAEVKETLTDVMRTNLYIYNYMTIPKDIATAFEISV